MNIKEEALQQSYKRLSELVGPELMLKIYEEYRGTQLSLPMKLYDREAVIAAVQREYPRHSVKQLADQYGYSQRWIQKIINQH
ncbi:Mor transcription activator family protein [Lapidilactobacillus luobeiensis]|uniref:Mor transcription activator family protein n=1 Tax=Lapidilactobacillus luobeiensis TaxID=2950371 RepID=UPI0021C45182|nr:Mor transcription activator family protein [Lapidilactobacillus luobeiensis]